MTPSSKYLAAVDADHRAIGQFVVSFARLVSELRIGMYYLINGGGLQQHHFHLLTGEMTAQPIANSFFAVIRSRDDAPIDESLKVLGRIERDVGDAITLRNDIMHGDWFVGYGEQGADLPSPAVLVRTKPARREAAMIVQEFTTADLEALTERVDTVRRHVQQLKAYYLHGGQSVFEGRPLADLFEVVDGRVAYQSGAPGFLFD